MIAKITLIISLTTILLLSGCNKAEPEKQEEIPKLEVTTPLREDTSVSKEYVCQIHAFRHIEVRALERGYVQAIFVDEGKMVAKDQPMFKIILTSTRQNC